jgi:hypothetical protein
MSSLETLVALTKTQGATALLTGNIHKNNREKNEQNVEDVLFIIFERVHLLRCCVYALQNCY